MFFAVVILIVLGIICLALLSGVSDRQDAARAISLKEQQDRAVESIKALTEATSGKDYFSGYWQHFCQMAGLPALDPAKLNEAFDTFSPRQAETDKLVHSLNRDNCQVIMPLVVKRSDALDSEIASFLGQEVRIKHNDPRFVKSVDSAFFKQYTGMSLAELESKILG